MVVQEVGKETRVSYTYSLPKQGNAVSVAMPEHQDVTFYWGNNN
jgi:hypothetical protein